MQNQAITNSLKAIIWFCLAVVLFSPLYVNTHLFFPYIVTKTIAFNIAVEVMFLAFLVLSWKNKNYKIVISPAVALFGVYIILIFISSLWGDNFYRSFWSNNERSEGLLLYLHLFAFLVVLTGFFRKFSNWLLVFDLFFAASALVSLTALDQFFGTNVLMQYSGEERLNGTIGNAGYMAGYLIFAIFLGLLLFIKRKNVYLRSVYALIVLLDLFIVLKTETRGGIIALFVSGILFLTYLLFFYFKNKNYKIIGAVIILLSLILAVLIFTNKESDFVKHSLILNRIASISTESVTAQARLMTWGSAWQGFQARPIIGWGQENFYQVFDKYFNPKMYDLVDVIWYDRAHNIVFDRLVSGGLIGLISYLLFLFVPLIYFGKYVKNNLKDGEHYLMVVILGLALLAYFIQNLFIFEALVTYVPLFLIISFVGLFGRTHRVKFLENERCKSGLLIIFMILFLPILYLVDIRPLKANIDVVKALGGVETLSINQRFQLLDSVLSRNTNGNQEYRQQYFYLFGNMMSQYGASKDENIHKTTSEIAKGLEKELIKQVAENPHSVTNYLLLMKFNNMAYIYDLNRLNHNVELFNQAVKLSPSRAYPYYEIGNAYLHLGSYFAQIKEKNKADVDFRLAVDYFKKALDLNKENLESHKQLINALMVAGMNEEAISYAQKAKALPKYGNNTWADQFIKDIKSKTE